MPQHHNPEPGPTPVFQSPSTLRRWLPILLILGVVLAYLPSLWGGFCYDDEPIILQDPVLQRWSTLPRVFVRPYWQEADNEFLFRPLTSLSFGFNWLLCEGRPWTFHLVNLLLHALNVLLLRRLLIRVGIPGPWAFAIPLLWGVHPLLTEDVAYLVGRADLLSGLFVLAGLTARSPWIAGLSFGLGLLSKENAVILPFLLLARYFFLDRNADPSVRLVPALIRRMAPLVLAGSAVAMWKLLLFGHLYRGVAVDPLSNPFIAGTAAQKVWGFWALIGAYGWKILAPLRLSIVYCANAFTLPGSPWRADVLFGLTVAAGLTWIWVTRRPSRPWLAMAGIAFLPFAQIVQPIGLALAERFMYLPLLFLLVGLLPLLPRRRWVPAALLALGLMWGGRTALRTFDYRSNEILFRSAVTVTPESFMAHYNYAQALVDRGELDGAVRHFREAARINPADEKTWMAMAWIQEKRGLTDDARRTLREYLLSHPGSDGSLKQYLALRPSAGERLEAMEAACGARPERADLWCALGAAALESDQPDTALMAYGHAWNLGARDAATALGGARAALDALDDGTALAYIKEAYALQRGAADLSQVLLSLMRLESDRSMSLLAQLASAFPMESAFSCALADQAHRANRDAEARLWIVPCLQTLPPIGEPRPYFEQLQTTLETRGER